MRQITNHKNYGLNDLIDIAATDSPGSGGANHEYQVTLPENAKLHNFTVSHDGVGLLIPFQKGPIGEVGVNGLSNESLLAILIDRLNGFQSGEFKCRENALALTKLEEAMHWLKHRTSGRVARGVEGTSEK